MTRTQASANAADLRARKCVQLFTGTKMDCAREIRLIRAAGIKCTARNGGLYVDPADEVAALAACRR